MIRRHPWGQGDPGCRSVRRLLQAYLDAEVPDTSALLVADHLDRCAPCRGEATAYRWLKASLGRLGRYPDATRLARLRSFADEVAATG